VLPEGAGEHVRWYGLDEDTVVVPDQMEMGIFGGDYGSTARGLVVEGGDVGVVRGGDLGFRGQCGDGSVWK
jgi:hypothetical protein